MVWANTAAILRAGLNPDEDVKDPVGGRFERDKENRLTGKAYEAPAIERIAGWLIYQLDPDPIQPLADLHQHMASQGLTTYADLGFSDDVREGMPLALGNNVAVFLDGDDDANSAATLRSCPPAAP